MGPKYTRAFVCRDSSICNARQEEMGKIIQCFEKLNIILLWQEPTFGLCVFHSNPTGALKVSSCSKCEFNLSPHPLGGGPQPNTGLDPLVSLNSSTCNNVPQCHMHQFGFWVIKHELPSVDVIFNQSFHHFHLLTQFPSDWAIICIC